MILRVLTDLAAPGGSRARLSSFYFHRVLERPDPLLPFEPHAEAFARMLSWITSQFRILDPVQACEALFGGRLPARSAILSFDDGYRDNFTVALPILRNRSLPAVFFVASGFLAGASMFNDRVIEAIRRCRFDSLRLPTILSDEPLEVSLRDEVQRREAIARVIRAVKHLPPAVRELRVNELEQAAGVEAVCGSMMTPEQVRSLHQVGMRVGGHTRTHPILRSLDERKAREEISGGLADLHSIIGERPSLFAYPNGRRGVDYEAVHCEMVRQAGCSFAFTTEPGAATTDSDAFELPRFTPWDRTRLRFGLRAWSNLARSQVAARRTRASI